VPVRDTRPLGQVIVIGTGPIGLHITGSSYLRWG
jgi:threonine dehydrogenase-like Zn-dependent dehydrogenase